MGYNKDKIHVPQINLALLCSADTGLPTMIRALSGSVNDIKRCITRSVSLNSRLEVRSSSLTGVSSLKVS